MKIFQNRFCSVFIFFLFFSCKTTSGIPNINTESTQEQNIQLEKTQINENKQITLLFTGDIMAHNVNYYISSFDKIWLDVKEEILNADLSFANIEAPIDTTKSFSSYPNFNMTKEFASSFINAGFNVFSLCNNHTNDQLFNGIKETQKTFKTLEKEAKQNDNQIYFSGLKENPKSSFSYNLINKNGWKILFLPITELLNRPDFSSYINFVKPDEKSRNEFIDFIQKIKQENPCDLFILSIHTSEVEYTRDVTKKQNDFYSLLLKNGVDVIWANHAHIIKDRKVIIDTESGNQKLIMYSNGNVISGQRPKPDFQSNYPNGERDNTGDGLFYKVTFSKQNNKIEIKNVQKCFVTTYINTANEYVVKKLDEEFVNYLYENNRKNWAEYIKKRIKINENETKDLISWQ